MRVRDVTTFVVPPGWVFVRVRTDEGVTGWGEGGHLSRGRAVVGAVEHLSTYLMGQDPLCIERHWQAFFRGGYHRSGPVLCSAVAALDTALWDIAGKARGVPIHELLGGPVRDRVDAYGWIGGDLGDAAPAALAEEALACVELGYRTVKYTPALPSRLGTREDIGAVVAQVAAVRDAIGPDRDVALDLHGRYSGPAALKLVRALEPLAPLWIEEPVLPQFPEAFAALTAASSVPIATGERLYNRWEFKPLLGSGLAVLQPDVSLSCGISETRRIADLGSVYDMLLAPHCALGPVTLAASLQLCLGLPNALIQERGVIEHFEAEFARYVSNMELFDLVDGCLRRVEGPGLGLVLDEAEIERAAQSTELWAAPVLTYPDGSYAEW